MRDASEILIIDLADIEILFPALIFSDHKS